MAGSKNSKSSSITLSPTFLSHLISLSPFNSLLTFSPKRSPRTHHVIVSSRALLLSLLISFTFLGFLIITLIPISQTPLPCSLSPSPSPLLFTSLLSNLFPPEKDNSISQITLSRSEMLPLPVHEIKGNNLTEEERWFWKQPNGEGFRPCLDFTIGYRKESARVSRERRRFLVVVVSGGLNQQRNQIVDAVVIARVLEAALVVPVLQVNHIWGDESEFSDIFDVEHFKKTLQADVRVVSSLPSTHLMSRQTIETQLPYDVPPLWIRARFFKQLNQEGVLVLKGLDSKLSRNLPPDLQKLRCKVAFHALRFAAPIWDLGNQLARRMWIEGPYIAVHLRLEKDVWVRTGCRTGLGPKYDEIIERERELDSEYLTGKSNMSYIDRRLAGMCPLNALEVARLLKALGAPNDARIYIAGGEPFGGTSKALKPLIEQFPNVITKEMLAKGGELSPYATRSSLLAAIDYIISLSSDVFMPSHGGNMGRALQGHRAYVRHRKFIKPNKRMMLPYFEEANNNNLSDSEFSIIMKKLHNKSQGQPERRTNKGSRDVIAYPVPECMCNH